MSGVGGAGTASSRKSCQGGQACPMMFAEDEVLAWSHLGRGRANCSGWFASRVMLYVDPGCVMMLVSGLARRFMPPQKSTARCA